jgi:hypothetical protein
LATVLVGTFSSSRRRLHGVKCAETRGASSAGRRVRAVRRGQARRAEQRPAARGLTRAAMRALIYAAGAYIALGATGAGSTHAAPAAGAAFVHKPGSAGELVRRRAGDPRAMGKRTHTLRMEAGDEPIDTKARVDAFNSMHTAAASMEASLARSPADEASVAEDPSSVLERVKAMMASQSPPATPSGRAAWSPPVGYTPDGSKEDRAQEAAKIMAQARGAASKRSSDGEGAEAVMARVSEMLRTESSPAAPGRTSWEPPAGYVPKAATSGRSQERDEKDQAQASVPDLQGKSPAQGAAPARSENDARSAGARSSQWNPPVGYEPLGRRREARGDEARATEKRGSESETGPDALQAPTQASARSRKRLQQRSSRLPLFLVAGDSIAASVLGDNS